MRTPRTRRTRGLTLIEAVISIAVFSVVSILSMMAMQTTGETTAMVSASFDAQLESERLLSLLRGQLQGTGTGAGGLAVIDANAGDKQIEVQYRPVDPAKLVFNPANPDDNPWMGAALVGTGPTWATGTLRVIKYEPSTGENFNNGTDDDNDGRIDEGQVRWYNRTYTAGVATDSNPQVLASEVTGFGISLNPTASPFPRLTITCSIQRPLPTRDGKKPMATHNGKLVLLVTN
jgi:hypothetical protein